MKHNKHQKLEDYLTGFGTFGGIIGGVAMCYYTLPTILNYLIGPPTPSIENAIEAMTLGVVIGGSEVIGCMFLGAGIGYLKSKLIGKWLDKEKW